MSDSPRQLKRELGVFGATLLGLGSILGTGVFVSLGIAAGIAGPAVLIAIVLAGFVALCNAMSSAQLAAAHPVAGGTYEYGYKYLNGFAGFTAGWMFLVAKSASAAAAALGVTSYFDSLIKADRYDAYGLELAGTLGPWSLVVVMALTAIVLAGIRRSTYANALLVGITVLALGLFVAIGLPVFVRAVPEITRDYVSSQAFDAEWVYAVAGATAYMFVAYAGYGRIATLSEEVRRPERTIPISILITLASTAVIYVAVAGVTIAVKLNAKGMYANTWGGATYLVGVVERAEGLYTQTYIRPVLTIAAITAMGGVLLNLILGLSRVMLAMGRRGDMPRATAYINKSGTTPTVAVIVVGLVIAALVLIGDVKATWSLSAFTVLVYYGITNVAALRLPPEHRRYPRALSWIGLASCALLALSVDTRTIAIGSAILAAGWVWFIITRYMRGPDSRTISPS